MKVRHFNTAFRASLLFFVVFSSSVALSDGECHLEQYADGTFRIVCEGGTINYTEELVTNHVYIIENCEQLKRELASKCLSLGFTLSNSVDSASSVFYPAMNSWNPSSSDEDAAKRSAVEAFEQVYNDSFFVVRGLTDPSFGDSSYNLYNRILGIECGSCSTNNSGSCCDVDLTPILRALNDAQLVRSSISNLLSSVYSLLRFRDSLDAFDVFHFSSWSGQYPAEWTYFPSDEEYETIFTHIRAISANIALCTTSVNNYLYKITEFQLSNISNNLEIVMSATTNLYIASTNHFSFFRSMTFQDSPLIDYSQQSTFDSYYDFLTNHYVKVSFKQYNGLVGDEKAKTNWFSRIETLLAALVFNDSEGTNTVDDTYGQSQQDNLINSLDGMNQTSTTQVNLMSNMGDSLLASLRSLNSSFSSAVSMPGEVTLATVGQDNSMQSNIIKFQSSEISQLVEACRCATTLAWCFGGIWLLFLFVSWSIKTSYSLCVFCWSVVSAIFGGGKT